MARYRGTNYGDYLIGGDGADVIYGLNGNDWIYAGSGNDLVYAGDGNDYAFLQNGNDTFSGGSGDDYAVGDDGRDTLRGDSGRDTLYGGADRDLLVGGAGDDYLYGGEDRDTLSGGDGHDYMRGGSGLDSYDGGAGDDYVSFYDFDATQAVVADLRTQTVANDGYGNKETFVSIEGLGAGTVFADTFYGNDADNLLQASFGDRAYGFGGDDTIYVAGIAGATVDGGEGRDTVLFVTNHLIRTENGSVVTDYANRGVTFEVAGGKVIDDGFGGSGKVTGFEIVIGTGLNDHLTGADTNDLLSGASGNDVVFGGAGKDTLSGGAGSDVLNGGGGRDVFYFDFYYDVEQRFGTIAPDVVQDFTEQDRLDIRNGDELLTFIGTDEFTGVGQIRYQIQDGDTYVYSNAEIQDFGYAVFSAKLLGVHELTADDFVKLRVDGMAALGLSDASTTHAAPFAHLGALADLALA